MKIHHLTAEEALASLHVGPGGLTSEEARRRLQEFGPNRVEGVAAGGEAHVLGGTVPLLPGSPASGDVVVLVRPEAVAVQADPSGDAEVAATSFLGSLGRVQVRTSHGVVLAQVPTRDVEQLPPGTRVRLSVRPTPALAVPRR